MTMPPGRPATVISGAALPALVLRVLFAGLVAALLLLARPASAEAALSAADDAAIRTEIARLLSSEPALPLPVRQRREGLAAYYDAGGPLLWIGTGRAPQFANWLASAAEDGLNPGDYPAAQLGRLAAAIEETDTAGQAVIELHFSAAFLQYASDLKAGRAADQGRPGLLPPEEDDRSGRGVSRPRAAARDRHLLQRLGVPQAPEYAGLRVIPSDYRALRRGGRVADGADGRR